MSKAKEYELVIASFIEEMRTRGHSDESIMQMFRTVLDDHPAEDSIENNEDPTKAEIYASVEGQNIKVRLRGGAQAMVLGIAVIIHDMAELVETRPKDIACTICKKVVTLDDALVTFRNPITTKIGREEYDH